MKFPTPKTVKQVQSFLGLTYYFRKFIKNYATITKPLSDVLRQENKFEFKETQRVALETLKKLLAERPVLSMILMLRRNYTPTSANMAMVLYYSRNIDWIRSYIQFIT